MPLFAIGLNHKTAPVQIRETVAFAPEKLTAVLKDLASQQYVSEAAIVSTCNRTELFCCVDHPDSNAIVDWFRTHHDLGKEDIDPYLYLHLDQDAAQHMMRVASGLDSMVLGEPQILGQMKDAYMQAKEAGTIGRQLDRLFQQAFSVSKKIRTDTAIGANPVSVAYAAVSLAKQIFSTLSEETALLIGAGDTIELTARHLSGNGIKRIIIANRSLSKAEHLAEQYDGLAISLGDIPNYLPESDIVISSTASQLPILGKGAVERAIKIRKHQPILMVDIAVPRDIEPEVSELNDVYLYTVDDLREIIDEGLKSRQAAAIQAEKIIDRQAIQFMGWLNSLDAVSSIRSYRENTERLRDSELKKAKHLLQQGADPKEVLDKMARALTNKILHTPSLMMRKASYEGREDLLRAARELLDLDDTDD